MLNGVIIVMLFCIDCVVTCFLTYRIGQYLLFYIPNDTIAVILTVIIFCLLGKYVGSMIIDIYRRIVKKWPWIKNY